MSREVIEGVQSQGEDEKITYSLSVFPLPVSITSVTVYDERTDLDVTSTVMPEGEATFVGGVIKLPPLQSLTIGRGYRVEVLYTDGINVLDPYLRVYCQ